MTNDTTSPFGTYALTGRRLKYLRAAQSMPANWLGRRAALLLRKLVLRRGPDIIDAEIHKLRFRLYMRDNVSERKYLFLPQFFDAEERELLWRSLGPGDSFADVGANAGIYTLWAARAVGEKGRVAAIEPNPVMIERLRCNIAFNGFEDRVLLPYLRETPEVSLPQLVILENSAKDWVQDLPAALVRAGYWCIRKTRMNLIYRRGREDGKA